MHHEFTLNGFRVPTDTAFFWSNHVLGKDERFFEDAEAFRPERCAGVRCTGNPDKVARDSSWAAHCEVADVLPWIVEIE